MALKDIKKQVAKTAGVAAAAAKVVGGKAAEAAAEGAKAASATAQKVGQDLRKAYYKPLFPDEFKQEDFDLPNMIVIVDEDERKGIDVCEGSIGWITKEPDIEVLHLYEEAVPFSGLDFFPSSSRYATYYSDPFDRNKYIDLSSYYEVMQKDKLTELRNIAHLLGAKECRLESYEADKSSSVKKRGGNAKVQASPIGKGDVSAEFNEKSQTENVRSVVFAQKFEGSDTPVEPELHWFAYDAEIISLIDMRLGRKTDNGMKEYRIELDYLSSSTLSSTLASKLDIALKRVGAKCNFLLSEESSKESRRRLTFFIEF